MDKEVAVWRGLGVERSSKFLLHPSGDLDSTVACHLHNPTFYVKDPDSQETDNDSNPSIRQMHQAGFSSKNCLFFDDICRRDRTEDVEAFYTEDLIRTHQEFMLSVRKAMSAKVEVCFGKRVFERMKACLQLVPLQEYRMARQEDLQCLRSAKWKDYLLMSPVQTLGYLPQTVETCCPQCQEKWLDMRPRWTTEKFSRYVKRVRKCTKCSKQSSFSRNDSAITSMAQSFCSKKWRQLMKAGVNPAAYQSRLEFLWLETGEKTKTEQFNTTSSDYDQPQKRRRIFNSKSRANRGRKE